MADQNEDFVSFEKALRDLKIQSEELKKLVSEGEIRAFRDGQSMKFRREDIESLASGSDSAGDDLIFEDLDDDTGMVTEELSEEDTLLAEDDLLEDDPAPARAPAAAAPAARTGRRQRIEIEEPEHEHVAFTAAAVICAIVMVFGMLVIYQIAWEQAPSGLTGMFSSKQG